MDFVQIIRDAEFKVMSYSGRGMFGRECLAIDLDEVGPIAAAARIVGSVNDQNEREEVMSFFEQTRTDNLGHGVVMFFPFLNPPTDEQMEGQDDSGDDEDEY